MAEPIIEKLRKLFALADESSGAGEHERQAAAAQAAKLMAKYDIDRAEVGDGEAPPSRTGMVKWRTISRDEVWIAMLATAISVGLGDPVEVIRWSGKGGGSNAEVHMVGSAVKIEFVQRLAEYLIPQLKLECEAALLRRKEEHAAGHDLPPFLIGIEEPKPWTGGDTRAFRQAFLKTAAQKIKVRIEDAYREETEGGSTALVLRYEQEENAEFLDAEGIKVKQRKTRVSSYEGMAAGESAAGRVDIRPNGKVSGGGKHQLGAGA